MEQKLALRLAFIANELGGNAAAAYHFADAGPTSGLSFGITQLDVSHNPSAVKCLRECGFTPVEIDLLKRKAGGGLSAKLAQHTSIVDRYDDAQITDCLNHVMSVSQEQHFSYADDEALIHAADYHNQFYLSTSGPMARYLAGLGRPVTGEDVLALKLTTAWGKKRPDDVHRRYDNIVRIMRG